jgi:hypothetical protein
MRVKTNPMTSDVDRLPRIPHFARTLGNDVGLHVVESWRPWTASVALTFRLGGVQRTYSDADGIKRRIPTGVTHLLEHLLFAGNREMLAQAGDGRGAQPNAVVTEDRTVWYIRNAALRPPDFVSDLSQLLYSLAQAVFVPPSDHALFKQHLSHELTIIELERSGRDDNASFQTWSFLRQALSRGPLGSDLFGDLDELKSTTFDDIIMAHQILTSTLSSIVVVCSPASEDIADDLANRISSMILDPLACGHKYAPILDVEAVDVCARFTAKGWSGPDTVSLGVKLQALNKAFASADGSLSRMAALSWSLPDGVCFNSLSGRIYVQHGRVEDPLSLIDPSVRTEIIDALLLNLISHLRDAGDNTYNQMMMKTYMGKKSRSILSFCLFAELYDIDISAIQDQAKEINAEDVQRLVDEVAAPEGHASLLYRGNWASIVNRFPPIE